jgi:hypothetical protein
METDPRDLLDKLLHIASPAEQKRRDPSLPKSTSIAGYPLFVAWGVWQGTEVNTSGTVKGLIFSSYLQNGTSGLTKFGGASAIENPLDMMVSAETPFNCKVSLSNCAVDVASLAQGEFYVFLLALKPAAANIGGKITPYWDAHLKYATRKLKDSQIQSYFKDFYECRQQWTKYLNADKNLHLPPLPLEEVFEDEPDLL